MSSSNPHRRDHARPITASARREAERAGWLAPSAPVRRIRRDAVPVISIGRQRRGSRRWLRLAALVVLAVGVAVVSAAQLGDSGQARTVAGGPSAGSSNGSSPAASVTVSPSPTTAPDPIGTPTPSDGANGLPVGYRWPLDHGRITSWFGPIPGQPFLVDGRSFHDGLDVASFCGDRVEAAHDGVVLVTGRHDDAWLGWVGSYEAHEARLDARHLWNTVAIVVIVDDGNGYRSIYMHLAKAVVKAGQHLRAGQFLGYEGQTGNATGCHLHYGLFSPTETATFETDPAAIKRWALPPAEIARIDPLLILPPMSTVEVTWGWGAKG